MSFKLHSFIENYFNNYFIYKIFINTDSEFYWNNIYAIDLRKVYLSKDAIFLKAQGNFMSVNLSISQNNSDIKWEEVDAINSNVYFDNKFYPIEEINWYLQPVVYSALMAIYKKSNLISFLTQIAFIEIGFTQIKDDNNSIILSSIECLKKLLVQFEENQILCYQFAKLILHYQMEKLNSTLTLLSDHLIGQNYY